MLRVLSSVIDEKEYYGLDDVDWSNIELSYAIPTYRVKDGTVCDNNMLLVPVVVDGTIVCHFFVVPVNNAETYVQLGTELVAALNTYKNFKNVAVVYDDLGAYLYSENQLHLLGYAQPPMLCAEVSQTDSAAVASEFVNLTPDQLIVEQVSTLNEEEFDIIECVPIETQDSLDVVTFLSSNPMPLSYTSKYLSVEIIQQPAGTYICWAIAMTSIINYLYNSNLEYSTIVNQLAYGVDEAMPINTVIANYNLHYDKTYTYQTSATRSPSFVLNLLVDGCPLYGSFSTGDAGHAVVIRGINTNTKTFSVMNPTPTTTSYTTGSISTTNIWKFVNAYDGYQYTLRAYAYKT